jgi:hypothetical protein
MNRSSLEKIDCIHARKYNFKSENKESALLDATKNLCSVVTEAKNQLFKSIAQDSIKISNNEDTQIQVDRRTRWVIMNIYELPIPLILRFEYSSKPDLQVIWSINEKYPTSENGITTPKNPKKLIIYGN